MAEQKNVQEQDINQLLKVRREKLADLQENGKDPFVITKFDVTHHSIEIKDHFEELEGKDVTVAGRIMSKRGQGKVVFSDIHDRDGKIQLFIKIDEVGEEALKSGEIEFLENNNGILGYERILNSDRIIIVVNMMEKEENILIDNIDGDILDLLDKDKEYVVENRKINILIKAHEFIILKVL